LFVVVRFMVGRVEGRDLAEVFSDFVREVGPHVVEVKLAVESTVGDSQASLLRSLGEMRAPPAGFFLQADPSDVKHDYWLLRMDGRTLHIRENEVRKSMGRAVPDSNGTLHLMSVFRTKDYRGRGDPEILSSRDLDCYLCSCPAGRDLLQGMGFHVQGVSRLDGSENPTVAFIRTDQLCLVRAENCMPSRSSVTQIDGPVRLIEQPASGVECFCTSGYVTAKGFGYIVVSGDRARDLSAMNGVVPLEPVLDDDGASLFSSFAEEALGLLGRLRG
jgi:hypothetical protein